MSVEIARLFDADEYLMVQNSESKPIINPRKKDKKTLDIAKAQTGLFEELTPDIPQISKADKSITSGKSNAPTIKVVGLFDDFFAAEDAKINTTTNIDTPLSDAVIQHKESALGLLDNVVRSELYAGDYLLSGYTTTTKTSTTPSITDESTAIDTPIENIPPQKQESSLVQIEDEYNLPQWLLEDKYYSISEVANLFNVNISNIRFWTTEFNLKVRTTRKGDRLYTITDIKKLRQIHHLVKDNKQSIQNAKEHLKQQKKQSINNDGLKHKLESLKTTLEMISRNL